MNICCGVFECGIGLGIPQPKTVCKGAPDLMSVVLAFLRSFGADVEADSGVADGVWLVVVDMEKGSDPPAGSLSPSVSRRQGRCRWRRWCRVVIASLLSRQRKVLLDAPSMSALKIAPSSCSLNPGNEPLRKVKECSKRHCAMSIFRLLQWMEYIPTHTVLLCDRLQLVLIPVRMDGRTSYKTVAWPRLSGHHNQMCCPERVSR